ncbi:hypothetical protein ACI79J_15475 [Geodermatophilus sp. SYSU D01062]
MTDLGTRSGSQILRTFLPQQTADLRRGIYRVVEWTSAQPLAVDPDVIRRRLLREVRPWEQAGLDNGVAADLRSGARIEVVELDERRGVTVERYPNVWVCDTCKRIGKRADRPCKCGAQRWGQLHFVGFHSCGAVVEPFIRRCPAHDDVKLVAPRSAKASDIRFVCPTCQQELMRGLGFNRSCPGCGQGAVSWNVHKARSVYAPRGAVLVNPPRPERMRELLAVGGARKSLEWVVEGMTARSPETMQGRPTREAFIAKLLRDNFDETFAQQAADLAEAGGQLAADDAPESVTGLDDAQRAEAENEALDIATALSESRITTGDLVGAPVDSVLARRYADDYPAALRAAGLVDVELIERFPVLNIMYGYTRGGGEAGATHLVPFRSRRGNGYRLHGDLAETEAYFLRLDPVRVAAWLLQRGHHLPGFDASAGPAAARAELLRATRMPLPGDPRTQPTVGGDVFELVHSVAHRFLRQTAVFAGIDRDALSEYLVPTHLGFFMYAAAKGDFVLGGLQAVFETDLDDLLNSVVRSESRCPLDPGCSRGAGACSACLHVGEPSCRAFNMHLSRKALFGEHGYFTASTV